MVRSLKPHPLWLCGCNVIGQDELGYTLCLALTQPKRHHRGVGEHHRGAGEHHRGAGEHHRGAGEHHRGAGEQHRGVGEHHRGVGEHHRGAGEHHRGAGEHQVTLTCPHRFQAKTTGWRG